MRDDGRERFSGNRIALGELLEGEAPVSENLRSNSACSLNLDAHGRHFKRAPMFVFDEILKQLLVHWDYLRSLDWKREQFFRSVFSIWCYPD